MVLTCPKCNSEIKLNKILVKNILNGIYGTSCENLLDKKHIYSDTDYVKEKYEEAKIEILYPQKEEEK